MIDVCSVQEMKRLLEEFNFHFTKAKGQNFLTQRWVVERMVQESGIDKSCAAVEIGPGFGALTQVLCQQAERVVALEVDNTLKSVLARTLGEFDNVDVRFCDALKTDLPALVAALPDGLTPVACANLPYYITSPVLTRLLESRCFSAVTVMVQKEVAQRICAKAGSADYSASTLFCNYYAEPRLLFEVPADCFMPRPKVTSAVVRLATRKTQPAEVLNEKMFFRTVKAAFGQRRKTLLNALSAAFGSLDKRELRERIVACDISPTVRGETLTLTQFARLANALQYQKIGEAYAPYDFS